jgi:hypothetical protein
MPWRVDIGVTFPRLDSALLPFVTLVIGLIGFLRGPHSPATPSSNDQRWRSAQSPPVRSDPSITRQIGCGAHDMRNMSTFLRRSIEKDTEKSSFDLAGNMGCRTCLARSARLAEDSIASGASGRIGN